MFLLGILGDEGGFDPLILLVLALMIDAYVGRFVSSGKFKLHPVNITARVVLWLDRKLNREHRSQGDRAVRGLVVALVLAAFAAGIGWGIAWSSQHFPFAWILETVLLILLIEQRSTFSDIGKVGRALTEEGPESARVWLQPHTEEATSKMDEYNLARVAIESAARGFVTGVVAPAFWYVLFGFPGMLVFKAVAVGDRLLGHRTDKYRAFGFTVARLNDILLIAPALLGGLFVVLGAIVAPTAGPVRSLKVMIRDAAKYRSVNLGWAVAAMAGSLNITLAGPRKFTQETQNDAWIGDGLTKATPGDLRRGLFLFAVACLFNAAFVAAFAVLRLT